MILVASYCWSLFVESMSVFLITSMAIVVSWTSVTSHSMFESGGGHLTADQVTPVLTNVAEPCSLLWWNLRGGTLVVLGCRQLFCVILVVVQQPPGAKTIKKSRAWIGAQLTICAQKWRNFVLFSTVSLRFVWSRVCVFLYSLGPWLESSIQQILKKI